MAFSAQRASHCVAQQKLSMRQTDWQQTASSQLGLLCALQHEPASDPPQLSTHTIAAAAAQLASHDASQQEGSAAHTMLQHARFEQEDSLRAMRQEPPEGLPQIAQRLVALATHDASHPLAQQLGSTAHTEEQQLASLQYDVLCIAKHDSVSI
jgi:hypothetical protein